MHTGHERPARVFGWRRPALPILRRRDLKVARPGRSTSRRTLALVLVPWPRKYLSHCTSFGVGREERGGLAPDGADAKGYGRAVSHDRIAPKAIAVLQRPKGRACCGLIQAAYDVCILDAAAGARARKRTRIRQRQLRSVRSLAVRVRWLIDMSRRAASAGHARRLPQRSPSDRMQMCIEHVHMQPGRFSAPSCTATERG
jgi:hypothetical protein